METILLYFGYNAAFTVAGILFLLTVQNFQTEPLPLMKFRGVLLTVVLSVLLTPLVAWGVSAVMRMRRIAVTVR